MHVAVSWTQIYPPILESHLVVQIELNFGSFYPYVADREEFSPDWLKQIITAHVFGAAVS
jgi:hypothetical protein